MPISIYPPTLKSTQSAFLASTGLYPVYFTLQSITAFTDIGHIQIRIVKQSNNRSIVDTRKYPDGIIYKSPQNIFLSGHQYYVNIPSEDLIERWQAGYVYKIQMRFGTKAMFNSVSEFATWKQTQIDQGNFSEWSTVMIVKAISDPMVEILNAEAVKQDVISSERTEASLTPLFTGAFTIAAVNKEPVDKYKFDLYSGQEVDEKQLLETSGWIQHNSSVSNVDTHRFKTVLERGEHYTVIYSIYTMNGYVKTSVPYDFVAAETYFADIEEVQLITKDNEIFCRENACINIYCQSTIPLNGCYVITRASEKTNFKVWEDLVFLTYFDKLCTEETLIHQDFTIESGIRYRYALQLENSAGLRTSPLYDLDTTPRTVDFEYSYLYRNGVQVKLKFNPQVSSFKHTTLRTKQDTLGDRYPHLVQNGQAYYAEFPISGLISFHMDRDQTFFTLKDDGFYYNRELVIPADKFDILDGTRAENEAGEPRKAFLIDHNLTDNNIFVERIFREKIEEFLNDFNYKLYKSPTEGNIIVGLMNINLTPNNTLGRMIFNFSATAYEILGNTLNNLNEFGIIDIGEFTNLSNDESYLSFGQVSGIYGQDVDIYSLIKQQEEISFNNGYRASLKQITTIWTENYPKINFTFKIMELMARWSETEDDEEKMAITEEIKIYEQLAKVLEGAESTTTILSINGTRVIVQPHRIYVLSEDIGALSLVSSNAPIIVNYICELTTIEDETAGVVSAVDSSRIWGQVAGVFTGTRDILSVYRYDYHTSETYRIYNNNPDPTIVYDAQGRVLVDNTNFNLYQTTNILDTIEEEARRQIELIYNIQLENVNGEYTNGTIYYTFVQLTSFDIEADEGTVLLIGNAKDGSDAKRVRIGPSGRYVLNMLEDNNIVHYIALEEPQFCVINYKCLTSQMKKIRSGG